LLYSSSFLRKRTGSALTTLKIPEQRQLIIVIIRPILSDKTAMPVMSGCNKKGKGTGPQA